jgi:hypothetical protein
LLRTFERMLQALAVLQFLVLVSLMLPKAVMFVSTGKLHNMLYSSGVINSY